MERLTMDRTKIFARESVTLNSISKKELRKLYNEVFDRLQAYEVAEEAGTLVRLPCKVGDKMYVITTFFDDATLTRKQKIKTRIVDYVTATHLYECNGVIFNDDDIGKTIFFTREEAEAALKARDGE